MVDAKIGSVTGTTEEIIVELGFKPSYVLLQNLSTYDKLEYWDSIANGSGLETEAAGADTAGIVALTTDGITVYDSYYDDTTGVSYAEGFKISADALINLDDVITYLAVR